TVVNLPVGWSTQGEDMQIDYYWVADGEGTMATKKVGITNPTPVMISDDLGDGAYMFTSPSTGKTYIWNMMMNEVYEYTKPVVLNDII
ncbi:hypothetical protein M434DRAFT_54875, partial [Hypoxylon sp. CO27-5]